MANLNTQSFSALVSSWAMAAQGAASQIVNFTIGSVFRAIDEATAYVALWLQGLILQVAALTRAATSNGTDLDSWFAQFGFARLPAVYATMQETFSRYTPTAQAIIPVGANVQSQDGSAVFTTIIDTTNANYSATLGAYILPAGTASINVTVQCTVAGTAGNITANSINSLATAISGVDFVNNSAASTNGVAAETDSAARSRFVLFIASLEAATLLAVQNAIASVQQGLSDTIAENTQYNGSTQNGYFTVVVDDGTGFPSSTILTNVGNAIERVRPLCSTYGVHAPVVETAIVSMTITTAVGYTHSAVAAQVVTALQTYINALTLGQALPYSILASVAYGVAGVINVTAVLLNGGTADLGATQQQVIICGAVTVS